MLPDAAGCAQAAPTTIAPSPVSISTSVPVTRVAGDASRTPLPSVTPTALGPVQPSSTSALLAAATNTSGAPLPTSASLLPGSAPAFDIKLPTGWKFGYTVLPLREPSVEASMSMALYTGPVKNGKATIVVLWGFPSMGAAPTLPGPGPTGTPVPGVTPLDYQSQLLWSDGLRLLQGTVFDMTCNVGRYQQLTFTVGGQNAVGAYFNASQCPDTPDTVGWFAGLNQFGGNYLFYVYIDPVDAYNEGRAEVQKVLDSVQFHAPKAVSATLGGPPPTNTPSAPKN